MNTTLLENSVSVTKIHRRWFIELIDGLSIEQINHIPDGFSNNIAWNFAHIVTSQQMLCYVRAGLKPHFEQELIDKYKNGTFPETRIEKEELDWLKNSAFTVFDVLEEDMKTGLFDSFTPFSTKMGVPIDQLSAAILYSGMHDNLHLGVAMAQKKLVSIV